MPEPAVSNYPRAIQTRYHGRAVTSWLRCFPLFFLVSVILTALSGFLILQKPAQELFADFLWAYIAVYIGLLPLLAVCYRLFPITIAPGGLKSFNGFGIYSQISWEELVQLSTLNLGGWKFYRFIRSRMLFGILVPFDLDDRNRFVTEMARYLGDHNPIVADLRSSWKLPASGSTSSLAGHSGI